MCSLLLLASSLRFMSKARMTGYSYLIGLGKSMPTKRPLCETWARMSHPDPNGPPDRRPIRVGEVWENPVTGVRLVILERPWDNPASRVTGELKIGRASCRERV